MYKQLIENNWTIRDVDEADYFHLLHLFSEVDSKNDNKQMSAEDFFKSIGQATE